MRGLVADDREPGLDQVGRRGRLDQPQRDLLRDRSGRVLGRDPSTPLVTNAGRHGQGTTCGAGAGLHFALLGHDGGGSMATWQTSPCLVTLTGYFSPSMH